MSEDRLDDDCFRGVLPQPRHLPGSDNESIKHDSRTSETRSGYRHGQVEPPLTVWLCVPSESSLSCVWRLHTEMFSGEIRPALNAQQFTQKFLPLKLDPRLWTLNGKHRSSEDCVRWKPNSTAGPVFLSSPDDAVRCTCDGLMYESRSLVPAWYASLPSMCSSS